MIAIWALLLVACVIGTSMSSRQAVTTALQITEKTRLSPALVGLTVMSVGTDLPEIANSLVSSASGHGDINVGDSMGSVVTQVTLVLGLLILFAGGVKPNKSFVLSVGSATFFACVTVWILVQDNELGRADGVVLVSLWIGGTLLLGSHELSPRKQSTEGQVRVLADVGKTLGWLGLVGAFAIGVVQSFLKLTEVFGIPEFVGSFVALSIGTSLPELVVDWSAIRRGASSMAVGDVFGSSFVDATLSVGIGPALFGSLLSSDVRAGVLYSAIGVLLVTLMVARSKHYNWRLALPLLILYGIIQGAVAFQGV